MGGLPPNTIVLLFYFNCQISWCKRKSQRVRSALPSAWGELSSCFTVGKVRIGVGALEVQSGTYLLPSPYVTILGSSGRYKRLPRHPEYEPKFSGRGVVVLA